MNKLWSDNIQELKKKGAVRFPEGDQKKHLCFKILLKEEKRVYSFPYTSYDIVYFERNLFVWISNKGKLFMAWDATLPKMRSVFDAYLNI